MDWFGAWLGDWLGARVMLLETQLNKLGSTWLKARFGVARGMTQLSSARLRTPLVWLNFAVVGP